MLNMVKMAVRIRDLETFRRALGSRPEPVYVTRNMPKRAEELLDGGSIYWVFGGGISARQLLVDIGAGTRADGSRCAALKTTLPLVPVVFRPMAAFQGWRYLDPSDAPPDVGSVTVPSTAADMPESLRKELGRLGLL